MKTTPLFFDCECSHDYIHLKSQTETCPKCNAHADDQPDSHLQEVIDYLTPAYAKFIGKMIAVDPTFDDELDRRIILTINRVDFSGEEWDEVVLWDDSQHSWVSVSEANKFIQTLENK